MHIFVDTNIYLGFYSFSKDDLRELEKLEAIVGRGDLSILLPRQVRSEIERNRERMLDEAVKKLREIRKEKPSYPQICRPYQEYEDMRRLKGAFDQKLTALIETVDIDIRNRNLLADNILDGLMREALELECSADVLSKARDRFDLGNPPGKSGSLGDAVIWESLLNEFDGKDIYFISDDKDFCSVLDRSKFKDVMLREWRDRKNGDLYFYATLTGFLRAHFPDIDLEDEREKAALTAQLSTSASFAETHRIIAALSQFGDFSDRQAIEIVECAFTNSQVLAISTDRDVAEFLDDITDGRQEVFDEDKLDALRGKATHGPEDTEFDDIPF